VISVPLWFHKKNLCTMRQLEPLVAQSTILRLRRIAADYGTPTYAFDVQRMRSQVEKLRSHLREVDILYSLKSNASLGICDVLAQAGIGADVASAGELATALAAGFPADRIFVAGPFKMPETIHHLRNLPAAVLSVDSLSELKELSDTGLSNPLVLRLRPDFGSCAVVPAGSESRFGFTCSDLEYYRAHLSGGPQKVIGFHVFAGSQVLDADQLCEHLRRSLELALRAAEAIQVDPALINLGGGFGTPYGPADEPLDLARVGEEFAKLVERAAPARMVLELGRYLVADAGYYLTSVMGHQTFQGRKAVVVDGGVHQRADMCGLCLRSKAHPPLLLRDDSDSSDRYPTDVLGCLSLPDDVMIEAALLPELRRGDVLAFANAGAYGIWSSPALFHGSPLPTEVAFDDSNIHLMRERKPASSILDDQKHVRLEKETVNL
jgi:diaminopimelate decarboxylase